MEKENDTKREGFWSGTRRCILWGLMTILCILWAAGIAVQIYRGPLIDAFNSLLQAGLIFLVWSLGQRLERMAKFNALLAEEIQRLEDVKIFVQAMRDIVKKTEAEQQADGKPEPPTFEESQGEKKQEGEI